jgi:hypothetical protein
MSSMYHFRVQLQNAAEPAIRCWGGNTALDNQQKQACEEGEQSVPAAVLNVERVQSRDYTRCIVPEPLASDMYSIQY